MRRGTSLFSFFPVPGFPSAWLLATIASGIWYGTFGSPGGRSLARSCAWACAGARRAVFAHVAQAHQQGSGQRSYLRSTDWGRRKDRAAGQKRHEEKTLFLLFASTFPPPWCGMLSAGLCPRSAPPSCACCAFRFISYYDLRLTHAIALLSELSREHTPLRCIWYCALPTTEA